MHPFSKPPYKKKASFEIYILEYSLNEASSQGRSDFFNNVKVSNKLSAVIKVNRGAFRILSNI